MIDAVRAKKRRKRGSPVRADALSTNTTSYGMNVGQYVSGVLGNGVGVADALGTTAGTETMDELARCPGEDSAPTSTDDAVACTSDELGLAANGIEVLD